MAFFNPFCSKEAISHSNYCTLLQKEYTSSESVPERMKQATDQVAQKLSTFVADLKKPRQELGLSTRKKSCSFGVYSQLGSTLATAGLCRDLVHFLQDQKNNKAPNPTFMAVFVTPAKLSENAFHRKVAEQLALLQKAAEPFYCTPESEAAKRQQDEQSLYFGGREMKVVSVYRNTSSGQLKFDYPMLAFTLQKEESTGSEHSSANDRQAHASDAFSKISNGLNQGHVKT